MPGYEGLNGEFVNRLQSMQNAAQNAGFDVNITSGFRSVEKQQKLWDAALAKYGDPEIADNWVARPGKSHHNQGIAADLGFGNSAAREWVHANAARFGLFFPMDWEPWHIEPLGIQSSSDPGAYTTPPAGHANPADVIDDPYDIGTQFQNFLGAMSLGQMQGAEVLASPEAPAAPDAPMGTQPETRLWDVAQSLEGGT
jgi:hypothetical protein